MLSDYAPLMVNISIFEEHIQIRKWTSIKNSKDKKNFITETIESIRRINTDHIKSKKNLEQIVQDFMCNIDKFWFKHSKFVNITIHSKSW